MRGEPRRDSGVLRSAGAATAVRCQHATQMGGSAYGMWGMLPRQATDSGPESSPAGCQLTGQPERISRAGCTTGAARAGTAVPNTTTPATPAAPPSTSRRRMAACSPPPAHHVAASKCRHDKPPDFVQTVTASPRTADVPRCSPGRACRCSPSDCNLCCIRATSRVWSPRVVLWDAWTECTRGRGNVEGASMLLCPQTALRLASEVQHCFARPFAASQLSRTPGVAAAHVPPLAAAGVWQTRYSVPIWTTSAQFRPPRTSRRWRTSSSRQCQTYSRCAPRPHCSHMTRTGGRSMCV